MVETLLYVEPVSRELVDGFIRVSNEKLGWKLKEDSEQRCSRVLHLLFDAITNFMSKVKSTEKPVCLELTDRDGNFQFIAKVEYHANDNPDMPGNWSYEYSFNPEDKEGDVYKSTSMEFKQVMLDIGEHQYGLVFFPADGIGLYESKLTGIADIIEMAILTIKDWIDENSVSETAVTTEIKGKVLIDACVDENGIKVGCITPSGEMKNIIKDDQCIESKMEENSK